MVNDVYSAGQTETKMKAESKNTVFECALCGKKYSHLQSFVKHSEAHKIRSQSEIPKNENLAKDALETSVQRPKRVSVRPKKFENSVFDFEADVQREFAISPYRCNTCKMHFRLKINNFCFHEITPRFAHTLFWQQALVCQSDLRFWNCIKIVFP